MCTLTITSAADLEHKQQVNRILGPHNTYNSPKWYIGFNRDEKKARPKEDPIRVHQTLGVKWISPIDSVSLGTWMAINDHGMFFALLNVNLDNPIELLKSKTSLPFAQMPFISRGSLIPKLIQTLDLSSFCKVFSEINLAAVAAFRLICFDTKQIHISSGLIEYVHNPSQNSKILNTTPKEIGSATFREQSIANSSNVPLFRTSFGGEGGDAIVQDFRKGVFLNLLKDTQDAQNSLRQFHFTSISGRENHSPLMHRTDASTTSVSFLTVYNNQVHWDYTPIQFPNPQIESVPLSLDMTFNTECLPCS